MKFALKIQISNLEGKLSLFCTVLWYIKFPSEQFLSSRLESLKGHWYHFTNNPLPFGILPRHVRENQYPLWISGCCNVMIFYGTHFFWIIIYRRKKILRHHHPITFLCDIIRAGFCYEDFFNEFLKFLK